MCSLILSLFYSNDLLKYESCVTKNMFQKTWGFEFIKKHFISKRKSGSITKVKLGTQIKKHNQLSFETLLLALQLL